MARERQLRVRSQGPRLRQDTPSPGSGTNRYGSSGSDTLTDSGNTGPTPSHLAPTQSQPARILLHIAAPRERGEMTASGSGGSAATQPEPLQSLLSLSSQLRDFAWPLLTLLVTGTQRVSVLSILIKMQHYSGCLNSDHQGRQ